jgi:hypothetical protein
MEMTAFWPCSFIEIVRRFRGTYIYILAAVRI